MVELAKRNIACNGRSRWGSLLVRIPWQASVCLILSLCSQGAGPIAPGENILGRSSGRSYDV